MKVLFYTQTGTAEDYATRYTQKAYLCPKEKIK
jgi:hypothetical protein